MHWEQYIYIPSITKHQNPGTDVPITEGPLLEAGSGLYYRYIELQNNAYILSNDMYVQSDNERCVLFWLGEQLQILLTTNVVR